MSANSITMQQSLASASQPRQGDTLIAWITCLFVVAMFALAWVGYVGGDDDIYSEAAMRFLQEGFFVGESHFEVRHPVIISIALSYALFGIGVMQLALVSTAYGAGTLLLMFLILKRFGTRTACLGVALLSSLPLFAIQASITYCDMVEVFFVVLSIFLFIKSIDSPNQVAWLILAGIITAVAFLSRTTTIGLLAG